MGYTCWLPALVAALAPTPEDDAAWTRWGGPSGDFQIRGGPPLVDGFPAAGPHVLWRSELGDGYSAILYRDGRLYTMYRAGGGDEERLEVVVALDAETGETLWDFAYPAGRYADMDQRFGEGPNATPLLLEDRIVTVGIAGQVHCLSLAGGDPLWELDLRETFGAQKRREEYGYSGTPLAYDGKVLLLAGGDRHAVVALDPADGELVWGSAPGRVSYAPPRLVRIAEADQYVYFSPTEVIGIDPAGGERLWSYPVRCVTENNLTSVADCGNDHLWVACQLDGGTRVLRIASGREGLVADPLWTSRRLRQGHWNSIVLGDHVYGALGDSSSQFGAVNWRTGDIVWRERGFPGAQVLYADGKVIFVDETGQLVLARVSPAGMEVLSAHPLLEEVAWTVPTLVGTRLYARDRASIVALDLDPERYGSD